MVTLETSSKLCVNGNFINLTCYCNDGWGNDVSLVRMNSCSVPNYYIFASDIMGIISSLIALVILFYYYYTGTDRKKDAKTIMAYAAISSFSSLIYSISHLIYGYPEPIFVFFLFISATSACLLVITYTFVFIRIIESNVKSWTHTSLTIVSWLCLFWVSICFFLLYFVLASLVYSDNPINFNLCVGICYCLLPCHVIVLVPFVHYALNDARKIAKGIFANALENDENNNAPTSRSSSAKALLKSMEQFELIACVGLPIGWIISAEWIGVIILLDFPYVWVTYPLFMIGPSCCCLGLVYISVLNPQRKALRKAAVNKDNGLIDEDVKSDSSKFKIGDNKKEQPLKRIGDSKQQQPSKNISFVKNVSINETSIINNNNNNNLLEEEDNNKTNKEDFMKLDLI